MSIADAIHETIAMINRVEIKGESNIAAMSRAISLLKGVAEAIGQTMEDSSYDGNNE